MWRKREPMTRFLVMALSFNILQRIDFIFSYLPSGIQQRRITDYFAKWTNGVPQNLTEMVAEFDSIRDQTLNLYELADIEPAPIAKKSKTYHALASLRQKLPFVDALYLWIDILILMHYICT